LKAEYESLYDYITQGAIIRSRANWYEKGEKSNKYFLNLENTRKSKGSARKIFMKDGRLTTNVKSIMDEAEHFYSDLYNEQNKVFSSKETATFISNSNLTRLDDEHRNICEGKLSYSECFNILGTFKSNKTPGNDGLTIEFYKHFWPLLGKQLVDALNYSYEMGELSTSQKQAIITLIEKKGKDRRYIENWRPISLINVDSKIASKVLAKRLEEVLPNIIHFDQHAFVKGRSIFDAVRNIEDILDYMKKVKEKGLLVAIDFEKAFDSLNWEFLHKTLEALNLGPSFINWVKALYSNVVSCVLNNGFVTNFFEIKRGVRQGDPLSPYLFIIALEVLANSIRNNKDIEGIKVNSNEMKLSIFADDMTAFLKDKQSISEFMKLITIYGGVSGLKLNKKKTEIMCLGEMPESILEDLDIEKKVNTIKVLGIFFSYDDNIKEKMNFEETLKSIKKTLNLWKWRGLTLIGKIQIIKTFIIPKFLYRAAMVTTNRRFVKELDKALYDYVWKGRDKVKRLTLIGDIKAGGLRMPHVDSIIKTQRFNCLKRYSESYPAYWKIILDKYLKNVGENFILQCNFDVTKLPINLPPYYKECFEIWSSAVQTFPETYKEIQSEIIWNNRYICSGGKSIYKRELIEKGIIRVDDLTDRHNKLTPSNSNRNFKLSTMEKWTIMIILDAIPPEWKNSLKLNVNSEDIDAYTKDITLSFDNEKIKLHKANSRSIYSFLVNQIHKPPTAQLKFAVKFPAYTFDWEKIYQLPYKVTLETKSREFQYKLLNSFLYTNTILHKMKLVSSPLCSLCANENESLEHLFYNCPFVQPFWSSLRETLTNVYINMNVLSCEDIIFGVFNISEDSNIINHIILLAKQYIYYCKIKKILPMIKIFIKKIKRTSQTEYIIAKENNILNKHYEKWGKLLTL